MEEGTGCAKDPQQDFRRELIEKLGGPEAVMRSALKNYFMEEMVRGADPVMMLNIACGLLERQAKLTTDLMMKMPLPPMIIDNPGKRKLEPDDCRNFFFRGPQNIFP